MERRVETVPAQETKDRKADKLFKFHAFLSVHKESADELPVVVHVEADRKSDLFERINDFPKAEIISIIKGRELKFQESKQIRFL